MKKINLILTLIVASFMMACSTTSPIQKETRPVNKINELSGNWILEYMAPTMAKGGTAKTLFPKQMPRMTLEANTLKVTGNSGCNNFFGSFTAEANKLKFSPLGSTMMACTNGQNDYDFLKPLETVTNYSISDKKLTLLQGDIAVMRFIKQEPR